MITAEQDSILPYRVRRPLPMDKEAFSDYVDQLIPNGTTYSEVQSKLRGMGFTEGEGDEPNRTRFDRDTVLGYGVLHRHIVVIEQADGRVTSVESNSGSLGL